jgi:outer membrane protein OmpU
LINIAKIQRLIIIIINKQKGDRMINLKKVGVTALAGSLAMFAANAEVTVSGSGELTYSSNSGSTGKHSSSTGNPLGMTHNFNITGTGEMDNGFTYKGNTNFDGADMALDSMYMTIDMGDMGAVSFDQGSGGWGIGSIENKVPTAYEEADHMVGSLAHGIDAAGATNVLGYVNSFSGVKLSLEYNPDISAQTNSQAGGNSGEGKTGTNYNFALTGAVTGIDGMTYAVGYSDTDYTLATTNDADEITAAVNYSMGPVSVGYQQSEINHNGGSTGGRVTAIGIAFNVNENLSVSYSMNDNEKTNASAAHVTEESKGYQAAYSMGSASIRFAMNTADNVGGVTDQNAENKELSLSLAF